MDKGTLVKDGFDFVGRNTSADGKGIKYEVGGQLTIADNITLFAQWKEQTIPPKPTDPVNPEKPTDSNKSNESSSGTIKGVPLPKTGANNILFGFAILSLF